MTKLSEIEAAIDGLPPAEKQQLLLFLAARLRGLTGQLPTPRKFSSDQIKQWIDEDESHLRRIGTPKTT